ncbi:MAG: hypothetical protein EG825_16465 [Rhodocyclaceae bacterium]|nr:hypothetical protein [Rhodocyclaceae bacterium]
MVTLSIALACLLAGAAAGGQQPVTAATQGDGAALLERLAVVARQNRLAAEKFLFEEEIVRLSVTPSGEQTLGRRNYEVSFLEGENYYRLVGENGAPLSIDDNMAEQERLVRVEQYRKRTPLEKRRRMAAKEERNRLKFDLEALASTHSATIAGPETINGRDVIAVDIAPAGKLRKPKNRNEWGRILAGRLWLDKATGYPVRADVNQLVEWDLQPAGNRTIFEWIWMDGAWLISSIQNSEPAATGDGTLITRQTYSSYSRFQAESKLTFTDLP